MAKQVTVRTFQFAFDASKQEAIEKFINDLNETENTSVVDVREVLVSEAHTFEARDFYEFFVTNPNISFFIEDSKVMNLWDGGDDEISVDPSFYENNGTPLNDDGDDMSYLRTEIRF